MSKKIRVVQYGTGKMSIYTMRYLMEKNAELVGAIDINPNLIGKDVNVLLGGDDLGIKITDIKDAEILLDKTKPDVCIITTMSLIDDVYESLMLCAKLGINAITICEEAFYSINSNPKKFHEIDQLAKLNNCTITGTGYQDIFWGNLISTLAASSQKITKIKGSSSYNVEDYGIALAKAHGAGLNKENFNEQIASSDNISEEERQVLINDGNFLPSYMWNVNGWLCDKLGLTVVSQTQKCIPQYASSDIHSQTLNMDVKCGLATGMSAIVTTNTKEGIIIEAECIGKIYEDTDFDKNEWSIIGEPTTTLVINRPSTVELTCATLINRIPDLLEAPAGFIPTSKFNEIKYRQSL